MLANLIQKALGSIGLGIIYLKDPIIDNDKEFLEIYSRCKPYTKTSRERMYSLYQAVRYIVSHDIPGELVECGVWKGGSCMLIALTLQHMGASRNLYLYDTFAGMTEPSEDDVSIRKRKNAVSLWGKQQRGDVNEWCLSPLEEVRTNMKSTGYAEEYIQFVQGRVEDTIPEQAPEKIALLRLDTDWYASTKHELIHLYPRLSRGGTLIVDDYGYWDGARKAVDEYFGDRPPLLVRVDEPGRVAIKIN